jgi:hypothetical protein
MIGVLNLNRITITTMLFVMFGLVFGVFGFSQVVCDNLSPENNQIDVNLSDAELRTDQDFSCNFNARICPIVFSDNNNDGIKNGSDISLLGIPIRLSSLDETVIYSTISTDASGNACFEPLADGQDYLVRVLAPPSPYLTTISDNLSFSISSSSGIQLAMFGYSSGNITLNAPSTMTFPSTVTKNVAETVSKELSYIEVVDTRIGSPGFVVTATVQNFISGSDQISIVDSWTSDPQTVQVITGSGNGLTPGATKTVTSDTDPFSVIEASSGNGLGTYRINDIFDLTIPAFTPIGNYESIITFTVI